MKKKLVPVVAKISTLRSRDIVPLPAINLLKIYSGHSVSNLLPRCFKRCNFKKAFKKNSSN